MINDNYIAFFKAQEVLSKNYIADYPVNIRKLINDYGIMLATIPEYEYFRQVTNETRPYIKIKDGRAIYNSNKNIFIIVYDDTRYNDRVRFTLAHELAHIILGHLNDIRTEIDRGGVPNSLYQRFEDEADTFAGTLLAPPVVVWEKYPFLDETYLSEIRRSFGLSTPAVRFYRIPDCEYWKHNCICTDIEFNILNNYVNRKSPKYCNVCDTQVFGKERIYCHICGNWLYNERGDIYMKYEKILTDKKGKALICPHCDNEEIIDGNYCQICGEYIVNECAHEVSYGYENYTSHQPCCEAAMGLPGNARYCPYCGSTTTFFDSKFLKKWDYDGTDDANDCDDIVGEDDDLPF